MKFWQDVHRLLKRFYYMVTMRVPSGHIMPMYDLYWAHIGKTVYRVVNYFMRGIMSFDATQYSSIK